MTSAAAVHPSLSAHCSIKALEGTSMAAPAAASYALKIRQYFTKGFYPSGTERHADGFVPSGALLKAILVHSGQQVHNILAASSFGSPQVLTSGYPSNQQGFGRIQVDKALNFGKSSLLPLTFFVVGCANSTSHHYAHIAKQTQVDGYTFRLSAPSAVRVTLAYTDYPGSPATSNAMVNVLSVTLRNLRTGALYSPYLPSGTVPSNLQVIIQYS